MTARIDHVTTIVPETMQALLALGKAADKGGVPAKTINLIHLRASQIPAGFLRGRHSVPSSASWDSAISR